MTVHYQVHGQGPDIVLLHGWAMHSGVWGPFAERLAEGHRVTLIDLPGFGQSDWRGESYELPVLAEQVCECAPDSAVWLGWSLGALLALEVAKQQPQRVSALIGLAATPKFVRDDTWPAAMAPEMLSAFSDGLAVDAAVTLRRFLSLLVQGAENGREQLRFLRERVGKGPVAHDQALASGLDILMQADQRSVLKAWDKPTLWLLGENDALIPSQSADVFASAQADISSCHVFPTAGHAPFLSHEEECAALIGEFVKRWVK